MRTVRSDGMMARIRARSRAWASQFSLPDYLNGWASKAASWRIPELLPLFLDLLIGRRAVNAQRDVHSKQPLSGWISNPRDSFRENLFGSSKLRWAPLGDVQSFSIGSHSADGGQPNWLAIHGVQSPVEAQGKSPGRDHPSKEMFFRPVNQRVCECYLLFFFHIKLVKMAGFEPAQVTLLSHAAALSNLSRLGARALSS